MTRGDKVRLERLIARLEREARHAHAPSVKQMLRKDIEAILTVLGAIQNQKGQLELNTPCTCWRKHSVNFAKGESCPRDIETLQAAWDRDQELIEEQRQELSRRLKKINQLRQEIESLKVGNK